MSGRPLDPPGTRFVDAFDLSGLSPLSRSFFERPVLDVARDLIGKFLLRRDESGRWMCGRVVEVEAYGGAGVDAAAHSFKGPTPRCQVMFGPAGLAYVYAAQNNCFCLNVTTGGKGGGRAVLLRAVEPVHGADLMRARRLVRLQEGPTRRRLLKGHCADLAQGPGRLSMCFAVDLSFNGADLTDGGGLMCLAGGEVELPPDLARAKPLSALEWTPRIGIKPHNPAADWAWRVADKASPSVSSRRVVRGKERADPHPSFDDVAR